MRRLGIALLLPPALLVLGCAEGTTRMVPLLAAAGIPLTEPITVPLEVVTRSTAVRDPLPVHGSSVVYGDIEASLGHAISSAAAPWADNHRNDVSGKDGWQLFVEITSADAEYDDGRLLFSVGIRATLRGRPGNVYLAQTQASCRQGGIVPPEQGAPIMYRCMTEIGHDLAGWLGGVDLGAVAASH